MNSFYKLIHSSYHQQLKLIILLYVLFFIIYYMIHKFILQFFLASSNTLNNQINSLHLGKGLLQAYKMQIGNVLQNAVLTDRHNRGYWHIVVGPCVTAVYRSSICMDRSRAQSPAILSTIIIGYNIADT